MGEQIHLQGVGMTEQQAGESMQIEAYSRLLPLLRSMGRLQEARTIEYALAQFSRESDTYRGKNPFVRLSNKDWAATIMDSTGTLVLTLGLFTILSLVYVTAKRWIRPEKKGSLYRIVTGAESWLAALLFLACAGLYLSYYPYAQNFRHYMTTGGGIHDLEPLWYNILPTYSGVSDYNVLSIGNPFRPYVWYALVGVVLVALAAIVLRRRRPRAHKREEVSAIARVAA
jgi:LPXTG-motif cell wall-anchored protein